MKRTIPMFVLIMTMLPAVLESAQAARRVSEESLRYENFGTVHIYRESPHPANVVLLASGEAGWNERTAEIARNLASLDTLVAGFDTGHYLRSLIGDGEKCSYYSGDLEDLSHYIQQKLGFPHYVFPILAGYSSGATLIYASLVQTPTGTFRGGISLAFCPGMLLPKQPCVGSGLEWKRPGKPPRSAPYVFRPSAGLAVPWIVIQGEADARCGYGTAADFVKQTAHARIIGIRGVGHGFSVKADWMPQFLEAYESLIRTLEERTASPQAPEVRDLPLVEIPSPGSASDVLAVIISGDGGWAGIDRELGQTLARGGISVVGVNSLQYFWTRRTPEAAAADLNRVLRHYLTAWGKRRAVLAGYSMGADVLAFMSARLPADLLQKVALVALLGPSPTVDFEFHFVGWLSDVSRKTDLRVGPEIAKLKGKPILCIYGVDEKDSLCKMLPEGLTRPVPMKDGHHFGGDYQSIAEIILKEAR